MGVEPPGFVLGSRPLTLHWGKRSSATVALGRPLPFVDRHCGRPGILVRHHRAVHHPATGQTPFSRTFGARCCHKAFPPLDRPTARFRGAGLWSLPRPIQRGEFCSSPRRVRGKLFEHHPNQSCAHADQSARLAAAPSDEGPLKVGRSRATLAATQFSTTSAQVGRTSADAERNLDEFGQVRSNIGRNNLETGALELLRMQGSCAGL